MVPSPSIILQPCMKSHTSVSEIIIIITMEPLLNDSLNKLYTVPIIMNMYYL